jgi:hypothetical protein
MVYCTKCGTQNEDNVTECINCKAPLQVSLTEDETQARGRNWEDDIEKGAEEFGRRAEEFGKRMENECFGLPHGGAIVGLIFGAFIIIIGASLAMGIDIGRVLGNSPWIGGAFIVIFGLLIVAGAIYGLTRKRR